jgi:hypothetical protein
LVEQTRPGDRRERRENRALFLGDALKLLSRFVRVPCSKMNVYEAVLVESRSVATTNQAKSPRSPEGFVATPSPTIAAIPRAVRERRKKKERR